jgi:hypothetical protein
MPSLLLSTQEMIVKRGMPRSPVIPRLGRLHETDDYSPVSAISRSLHQSQNAGPDVSDVSTPGKPTVLDHSSINNSIH